MTAINMGFRNRQAFALLESLAKELKGINHPVQNIGDYINVMSDLKAQFSSDTEFFNAVYDNITMKLAPIVWEIAKAETPYSFVESTMEDVQGMRREGVVFSRELDEQTYSPTYFGMYGQDDNPAGKVDGDENISNIPDEDKLLLMQYRKKDLPTKVLGTFGHTSMTDHITVYKGTFIKAYTDPYEFYNMFAAIKSQWLEDWKEKKGQWETNTFKNLLVNTYMTADDSGTKYKVVKLLTEYNTLYGKNLTKENWYKEGNIEHFAPWCYIKINKVLKQLTFKADIYQTPTVTTFRGKNYQWIYAVPKERITSVFLEEPFDLMKSYSNAQVFNENDLMKVDEKKVPYWFNPIVPEEVSCGTHIETHGNEVVKVEANFTCNTILGIAYDKKAIATATVTEASEITPWNVVTEHANIWNKAVLTNYFNPYRKAVVFTLE